MTKRLDTILVVDLESTCWEGPPPAGQEHEIIEIGLCLLEVATLERVEKRAILVRPARSTLSPFCIALTTLTQEELEREGLSLAKACALLREEYCSQARPWASYGEYDRYQLERECRRKGVPYPFGARHLNVKTLFALAHALPREIPLDEALRLRGFPLEGTHHRGLDDAWNIARLLGELLGQARNP
jgi:inhibitor of KinA sporulation pathway (predicted exonuclease)